MLIWLTPYHDPKNPAEAQIGGGLYSVDHTGRRFRHIDEPEYRDVIAPLHLPQVGDPGHPEDGLRLAVAAVHYGYRIAA